MRWGLPDVAIAWIAGLVGSVIVGSLVVAAIDAPADDVADDVTILLAAGVAQNVCMLAVLAAIIRRKGRGVRADLGLTLPPEPAGRVPTALRYFGMGLGLQVVLIPVLVPLVRLYGEAEQQGVVDAFEGARGVELALFALFAAVVAPFAEEVLFRGALLRGLLRRMTPGWAVFVSALVFAVIHPLLGGSIGDVIAVPGLFAVGLVLGVVAVRTRSLYGPVLLHAGFNSLTVIGVLAN